jgi:hypothetical protein
MRHRARVIATVTVAAALAAGSVGATVASATGAKPGDHAKTVPASGERAADSDLAARLGTSPARLDQALRAVKTSLGKASAKPTEGQFEAALARILGIPQARVRQAFPGGESAAGSKAAGSEAGGSEAAGSEAGGSEAAGSEAAGSEAAGSEAAGSKAAGSKEAVPPGNDALTAAVAGRLHVSAARVNAALRPLFAAGTIDSSSPAFAAAGRSLGVGTQQLSDALAHAKHSLAGGK